MATNVLVRFAAGEKGKFRWAVYDRDTAAQLGSGRGRVNGAWRAVHAAEFAALREAVEWLGCLVPWPKTVRLKGSSRQVLSAAAGQFRFKAPHLLRPERRVRSLLRRMGCAVETCWIPRDVPAGREKAERM